MGNEWVKIKSALRSASFLKIVLVGLLLGSLLAMAVPAVVGHFRMPPSLPTLDANTQAYILIMQGIETGRYADGKAKFDEAYSISSDPELRYVADYCSRSCQLALESGISTHEEANSLEGGIKGIIHGYVAPMSSISAVALLFKGWLGDLEKNCKIADRRYLPVVREYIAALNQVEVAKRTTSHFYWILFWGTPASLLFYARNLRQQTSVPDSVATKV